MKFKSHISLIVVVLFLNLSGIAQVVLERQVIGTTGGTSAAASWGTIDYTLGECMVTTLDPSGNYVLTQGFHQPTDGDTIPIGDSLNLIIVNSPCIGANTGSVTITSFYKDWPGYIAVYLYTSFGGSTYTIVNDTIFSPPPNDSYTFNDIPPGTYNYTISIGNGDTVSNVIVITENQSPCLSFYNGITPNGDGNNESWIIEQIEFYKENKVSIFNRWGDIVWSGINYDNVNVVWTGRNTAGGELADATYFYILEIEGRVYKGWVELTH